MKIAMLGGRGVPARYSGSETCVEEVGARLAARGHDVIVYCRRHNSELDAPTYRGMRRVVLPSLNTKHFDTLSHTLIALAHNYTHGPADILHFHGVGNSLFFPLIKVLPGRAVITVDGPDWERPKWGRAARAILKLAARLAMGLAAVVINDSRRSQEYYQTHFQKATCYIPYGADVARVEAADALAQFGLLSRRYLLFVGRLVPDKGVHLLVEAFQQVKTDLQLIIVGDSPLYPDYIRQLKSTGDSRIRFLGFVFGEPYRQLCAHAYAYVHPTLVEGTSPALLAAMGAGNCVVVNGIPENLETIGEAGLAFARDDARDLQRVLQALVDDADRVKHYRVLARQRVMEAYNWDTIALSHEQLYQSALANRAHTVPSTTS